MTIIHIHINVQNNNNNKNIIYRMHLFYTIFYQLVNRKINRREGKNKKHIKRKKFGELNDLRYREIPNKLMIC